MVIYWKIFYADIVDHKSHERSVYLNTKDLSSIDKIFVEIALKKQELFNDSELFIPLRRLFITMGQGKNIPFTKADVRLTCVMNLYSIYREDQDGNEIDYSQFLSILRGENITLRPGYSCIYNRSISEEDLNRFIVWNKYPLKKEDFNFSSQDVNVLRLFCSDAKILRDSHFLGHDSLPSLHFMPEANRPYQVDYKIDSSEKDSVYMVFRRLIMENEMACFFKIKKIILNKLKNRHNSFDILYSKWKKINDLWKKDGEELFVAKGLLHNIPELSGICWGKFIHAVLNHGLFHQKDQDETQIKYEQYETVINDKKTFDALFYIAVHEIARLICDWTSYIEDILSFLGEPLETANSSKRPIAIQDEFQKFVTQKTGELAFYLSRNDNEMSYEKALQQAMDILQETFKGKLWA